MFYQAWLVPSAQAIAAGWLIWRLKQRFPLRMAGRDAMKNLSKFLGPTGKAPCPLSDMAQCMLQPCLCCIPKHACYCRCHHFGSHATHRVWLRAVAGLLALRTVAISGTFALATSLAARSDLAHAAAHQICLQLWLASSLLADSLAVAAQTLIAQGVAAKELRQTRKVFPLWPVACL